MESENDIMAQIQRLAKTKTVILISHRLANVANVDNIYVLDKGNIAESGDHDTLLKLGGTYAKLWNAQQEEERMKDTAGRNSAMTNTVILIFDLAMLFLSARLCGFEGCLIVTLALMSSFGPVVALAALGATDDEIIAACKKAYVHDFIMSLPMPPVSLV